VRAVLDHIELDAAAIPIGPPGAARQASLKSLEWEQKYRELVHEGG
jgi:hypothetical protein